MDKIMRIPKPVTYSIRAMFERGEVLPRFVEEDVYTLNLEINDKDKQAIREIHQQMMELQVKNIRAKRILVGRFAYESIIRDCSLMVGGFVEPSEYRNMEIIVLGEDSYFVKVLADNKHEWLYGR